MLKVDRPIEILALPPRLHELFDDTVSPRTNGSAGERERNFLSRALTAYTLHKLGGAALDEAASGVVDGGGDGGIDGVYFSPVTNILWLTQAKYVHSGIEEPDLGEVIKFKDGLENMLSGRFEVFARNPQLLALQPQLEAMISSSSTQVRAVLCYSGLRLISEDRKRLFEHLKSRVSKDQEDEYFKFFSVNLTTLNDWITGGDDGPGINSVELEIFYPGLVTKPYEMIYGLISLERLKALHDEYGINLIRANIRGFKGNTDVNADILRTLTNEVSFFHYFNNGLTAYCNRFELNNFDRDNSTRKRVTAKGFAIINGAQTLGSIGMCGAAANVGSELASGYAFIKIVSLEKCEDDQAFAERVSRAANFQNPVSLRDFAAAYPLHEQMRRTLKPHGIGYCYRIDEDTPESDEQHFSIEEALTACACLHTAKDCDLLYRVAANRDSLRSLEMVFPLGEIARTRHELVFPAGLSARTAWRAVQTQRIVLAAMRNSAKASKGATRSFYTYARWVVLAAVFSKIKPEVGEELTLSEIERACVSAATVDHAEKLLALAVAKGFASYDTAPGGVQALSSTRDFQSVFKTQGDCQTLFAALRGEIWKGGSAAGEASAEGAR